VIDECFAKVEPLVGTKTACRAVGRGRATHYRRKKPGRVTAPKPRPAPKNKLTDTEVEAIVDVLTPLTEIPQVRSPKFPTLRTRLM